MSGDRFETDTLTTRKRMIRPTDDSVPSREQRLNSQIAVSRRQRHQPEVDRVIEDELVDFG